MGFVSLPALKLLDAFDPLSPFIFDFVEALVLYSLERRGEMKVLVRGKCMCLHCKVNRLVLESLVEKLGLQNLPFNLQTLSGLQLGREGSSVDGSCWHEAQELVHCYYS